MSFQSIPDATTSIKGKASFNTANFVATAGDITIKAGGVTSAEVANGAVVQVVNTTTTALATGTTVIPTDDTIPQITEGDEYMTLAITPKATTNVLVISVDIFLSHQAATTDICAALFQDATANALAVSAGHMATATGMLHLQIQHTMAAGTTSSTTFRLRAGGHNAGTTSFNGQGGARKYGASVKSSMVIAEYKA